MFNIPVIHLLTVGIGGMVGSMMRYMVSTLFVKTMTPAWPWATFYVNLAGCLLLGGIMAVVWKSPNGDLWKLLLATGFCGGFTTFSAFSYEGFQMLRHEMYGLFTAYALSSLILGVVCILAGFYITKKIFL